MSKEGFFNSAACLAAHLKSKNENISPLRLQKTLYFLFAFYGASYGLIRNEKEADGFFEGGENYPQYLFNEEFEAWQYGPVIRNVYTLNKSDSLIANEWTPLTKKDKAVEALIQLVCKQLDQMGDFSLVERSHEDEAWKDAYAKGASTLMDKDDIINGYKSAVF